MQLITRYRSYSSLFWLSHEPFAVSRIKDLSTYLIYISLVFSPVIDDSVDSGVTAEATCPDRSRKENLKKRQRRGSAAACLIFFQEGLRRTSGSARGFCSGTFVRSFRITRIPVSCGARKAETVRMQDVLPRNDSWKKRRRSLVGIDEWLFIAAENIPVIRLLSTEKCVAHESFVIFGDLVR